MFAALCLVALLPWPVAEAAPLSPLNQISGRSDIALGMAGIDVNGQVVAVAHVLTTNGALMLTLSTDGGMTWNDYATGITGLPTAADADFATHPPEPVAVSASNIAILYRSGSNTEVITKTTDGGVNWSTAVSNLNPGGACTVSNFTNTLNDVARVGTTVLYTGGGWGASGATATVYRTTDFWATAPTLLKSSTQGTATCSGGSGGKLIQSTALFPTSTTDPCVYYSWGSKRSLGPDNHFSTDLAVSNALCTGSQAFQDPISALSNYGWNLRVDHANFNTAVFGRGWDPGAGTTGPVHVGDKQATTGKWFFTQQAATIAAFGGYTATPYSVNGAKGYFASPDSGTDYLTRYENTGGGYTASQAVAGTASSIQVNPGVYEDCAGGKLWVVLKESSRLKVSSQVVSCTPPPPEGAAYAFGPQQYFCAERGAEKFGYNYLEGVTFDDAQSPVRGLSDAYKFSGDASNFDYLGKTLPGSPGAKVYFTLEADSEGTDSVFRTVLSFVDHSPYDLDDGSTDPNAPHYLNGPDDPGDNAKGNGKDSEVFAEQIEVRFLEQDNDWNIRVFYVSQSNDVDERTAIGTAKLADDPNDPTSYVLTVDTRMAAPYVSVRHADGTQIGNSVVDSLNLTLPSDLVGKTVYGQWFVGYGVDTATNFNARTWLNNNDGDAGSTCVYLLNELDENGDPAPLDCIGQCGSQGPVLVNTPNGTVPEGLTTCAQTNSCAGGGAGAAPAGAAGGLAGAGCGFSELLGFSDCDGGAWFIVAALALVFGQVGAAILGRWGLALPGFLVGGALAVIISWKGGAIEDGPMFVLMFLVLATGLLRSLVFGGAAKGGR